MAQSADIIVNVLARTAQFNRRMDRVGRQLNTIQRSAKQFSFAIKAAGAAISAFATTQLAGAVRQQLAFAGTLQRVSETVGFTAEAVQEYRFAAEQLNIQTRAVDLGLQRFSRRVAEAAQGQGELVKVAEQYNIQLRDADGNLRSNEDILGQFAETVRGTRDEQERLRIAFKLFDSEGASLVRLLSQGRTGLNEFKDAARDAGAVLDNELVDKAAEADRVLVEIGQSLRGRFLEAVARNADELARLGESLGDIAEAAINATEKLAPFFETVIFGYQQLGELLDRFTDPEAATELARQLREVQSEVDSLNSIIEQTGGNSALIARRDELVETLSVLRAAQNAEANEAVANYQKQEAAARQYGETLEEIVVNAQEKVIEGEGVLEEIAVDAITGETERTRRLRRNLRERQRALQAQRDEVEANRRAAEELGFTFTSAFEDAIVEGRKFSDVLKGLGQDLLRLFVRNTVTAPAANFLSGLFSRDSGGTFQKDQPFFSGTPELIIPSGSGTVKPTMAGVGGMTVNNTYNFYPGADAARIRAEVIPLLEKTSDATLARVQSEQAEGRL